MHLRSFNMNSPVYIPVGQFPRVRISMQAAALPAAPADSTGGYGVLAMLAMALGTVVMVEPAPVDIAIVALLLSGLALRRLRFVAGHELPLVLLGAFVLANILSLMDAWDMAAAYRYLGITIYLICTWVF